MEPAAGAALPELSLANHLDQDDQTFRHPTGMSAAGLQVCRTVGCTCACHGEGGRIALELQQGKVGLPFFTMNWHIHEAVRQLAAGGIVAYPTETVYGLGCDPFNGQAVLHLLSLKKRDVNQGLILVASEFSQLEPLLLPLKPAEKNVYAAHLRRP